MACENCKTGFKWNGSPTGKESKLDNIDTYIAGDNKDRAILIVTDVFGWTLPNARLLADHYAKEVNATVYVPDLFAGEIVDPDALSDPEKAKKFDLGAFLTRHSKDNRWPQIKQHAQTLKRQYLKVGAVGFCYGGWAVLRCAADPALIDAVATAHPSLVEKSELDGVKVPVQILAPEDDFAYTEELKAYTHQALPKARVPWEYVYFPRLAHGFACRGDQNDTMAREGLERAKRSVVAWFIEYLH